MKTSLLDIQLTQAIKKLHPIRHQLCAWIWDEVVLAFVNKNPGQVFRMNGAADAINGIPTSQNVNVGTAFLPSVEKTQTSALSLKAL